MMLLPSASVMKCNRKGINPLNITEKDPAALSDFLRHSIAFCRPPDRESRLSGAGGYHNLNLDSGRRLTSTGASIVSSLQPTVLFRREARDGSSGKDPFFKGLSLVK